MNGKAPAPAAREQHAAYSVTPSPSAGECAHSIPSPLTGEGQGGGESKTILLPHLDLFPAAPEGFKRLRELVLNLAVRGRLVLQDPTDFSAGELLKQITLEREQLVRNGVSKKPKAIWRVDESEQPFDIPLGWAWVPLGSIGEVGSSSRVHQKDWTANGVPFYRAREIVKLSNCGFVQNELFIAEDHYRRLSEHGLVPKTNDIMITGVGTIGVPYIVRSTDKFYFKDASVLIFKNHHGLCSEYLFYFMKSSFWVEQIHAGSMGTTVHTLTIARANEIPVPLPPLAEQSCIVAKVEELMALIDRLEAKAADAEAARGKLLQALLAALADSPDAAATARAWGELAPHFDWLLQTPQDVDRLQQTVLQIAVKGRLVPQDPADEPAVQLLQRIRAEKERFAAAGKLKRDKPLPTVTEAEPPYALPEGWEWVRLGELIVQGPQNGFSPKPVEHVTDVRCLSLSATTSGFFKDQWFKYVDISLAQAGPYFLKGGDFLVQRANSLEYVGVSAIYKGEDDLFIFPDLMMRFRVAELEEGYLHTVLLSAFCREFFRSKATGTQGNMPKINQGTLISAPIPLPPLAEQSRIVAQVEALTALCDRLRRCLAARRELAGKLAGAMVEEAAA